ncbi:MAG: histidine phosphatase family protein [Clostridia bacterium]|nr:histidine phosphatase family protein [Clostridia bacterium]
MAEQKIYLLRHGATVANEQRLYCGKSDLPLSPTGLDALHRRAAQGGYPKAEGCRVCTSGMLRTRQTLEAIYGAVESETLPAFREIDFGAFELQSYEQLREREDYQTWLSGDNARNRCPGGESGEDVANRVHPAFAALLADGRDTILVTHGGVIAAILTDLYPDSLNSRYDWQPEPGCGWALTFRAGEPVACEPIPDPHLGEERSLGRTWAWVSAALLAGAILSLLAGAGRSMKGGSPALGLILCVVLLIASQGVRFVKLRCPWCGKSVAPLRILSGGKLVCPRCGRKYQYR